MYDELVKDLRRMANTWLAEEYKVCAEAVRFQTREAADAIEELQQQVEHYRGCMNDWFETAQEYKAAVPKWIPVTERLPEERTDVLAMTADCDIYVCDFIPSVRQFWTIPGDDLHIDDITHWMPLPEPPEEE